MVTPHTRPVTPGDHPRLEAIRQAAFAPIFASFRAVMGDEIYELAQANEDANQGELLRSMIHPGSGWDLFVAEHASSIVGFVAVRADPATRIGEIGLNAVDPAHAGHGIGASMYQFALDHLKRAGCRVATVSTGGDPSHAAARRAYEKVGFDVSFPSVWMCRLL